jgi:hypothetical protein
LTDPVDARLLILIPIFEDWAAAALLLVDLDRALHEAQLRATVWLVDDGSMEPPDPADRRRAATRRSSRSTSSRFAAISDISAPSPSVWPPRTNSSVPRAVVVMDGDGQDAPNDVPRLVAALRACGGQKIIFGERRRRAEHAMFQAFYTAYRWGHRLLDRPRRSRRQLQHRTGGSARSHRRRLRVVESLRRRRCSRRGFRTRTSRRAGCARLSGPSKMNFTALVSHGLRALSVHAELIGVRLMVLTLLLVTVLTAATLMVFGMWLMAPSAVPAWALSLTGVLALLLGQTVASAVVFVFLVLHGRSQPLFIPIRDYVYFVKTLTSLSPAASTSARIG